MGRRITLLLPACAIALVAACGPAASPAPSPSANVARVGQTLITQAAFDVRVHSALTTLQQGGAPPSVAAMLNQVRASVLRSLILDTVIAQEATADGLAATPAEVQAQVDADTQSAGGANQLQTQLAEAGGSLAQLQDQIRSQLNEQRLEDAFAKQRAAEVEKRLASGAGFLQVAREMSDDTGTSAKGGDLGVIKTADLPHYDSAFVGAMRSLDVNSYTRSPVRDSGGYDILQVYARASDSWSVRHILVAAPTPYTVTSRPAWFAEALFATVAQLCTQQQIQVYISDAGADPCKGAPVLTPPAQATPG